MRDSNKQGLDFKFIVKGNHPIFKRIDRRCLSFEEANNVRKGLIAIGYVIEIEPLKGYSK